MGPQNYQQLLDKLPRPQRRQMARDLKLASKLGHDGVEVVLQRGSPVVLGLPLADEFVPRRKQHTVTGLIIYPRRKVGQVTGPIRNLKPETGNA